MFKNYTDARDWLESYIPLVYGKEELGLARIENLLEKLGNPQNKFKSIHVGGTSGKGSTAYYIARLLQYSKLETLNSKLKTNTKSQNSKIKKGDDSDFGFRISDLKPIKIGLHISPHLVYVGERMQIFQGYREKGIGDSLRDNAVPVKRLISLVNQIKPVIDDIATKQPQFLPSYFEILVAASFLYFEKEKVDFAVVEVGLGGRLDATNVLNPEISVITNVGLDHMEILGDTVEKIATEKAGIIKGAFSVKRIASRKKMGTPVVTGATGKALAVVEKVALGKKSSLIKLNTQNDLVMPKTDAFGYINEPYYMFRSQGGSFVSKNQNLALITVLGLGIKLDKKIVEKAMNRGYIGRFEQISDLVVLDGAHNVDKVKALVGMVNSQFPSAKVSLVLAFKSGKNWKEMVDILFKNLRVKSVVATQYFASTDMGKGSAVDPQEVASYVQEVYRLSTTVYCNSQEAVFDTINSSVVLSESEGSKKRDSSSTIQNDKTLFLVTGSLYLVGEARTLWQLPQF